MQNKTFQITEGSKQIVTFSVSNFRDTEEYWIHLEDLGAKITASSEIAGVYFFTLPPDEISNIDVLYTDFSPYGMNLIATFWKDPVSGSEIRRYPNTDGN